MKITWIAAAALAALVVSATAAATPTLSLQHLIGTRRDDVFRLRIDLNQPWKSGVLAKGTGTTLTVLYETSGDSKTDYTGRISFHNGQLFEHITGQGSTFPDVLVTRPTATAARFMHPSDVLFPDPENPGPLGLAVVLNQGGVLSRLPVKGWWTIPRPR